jgi:hypothetical protein
MFILIATLLMGCDDPFADAQKANTIDGWEQYLATKPSGADAMVAQKSLAQLMVDKARETKSLADYDAVIKRFPDYKDIKTLQDERTIIAYTQADSANTLEAWKKFLDENPDATKLQKDRARGMVGVAEYGKLQVGQVAMEQVNLAEDPKGPKDGWGFKVPITNSGDKEIEYLSIEIRYLDAAGKQLSSEKWPLVAQQGPGGVPVSDETTKNMKPGETRVWDYTTGNVPPAWSKQVQVVPIAVRFVGTPPNEGAHPK